MAATVKFYNTDIRPATDLGLDLGTSAFRYNRVFCLNLTAGGLTYTMPTANASGFLKNDGAGVLTWSSADTGFVSLNKWSVDG